MDEFEDDESDGSKELEDADVELQNVTCLFCDATFPDDVSVFVHCRDVHNFNICHMKRLHGLDCIAYTKLINFIRQRAS